ncbi:hypothetical protein [Azospirillum brasilense]|uniref:hypothetical protein n=1 Tax=Azospirillum brasilense TaxID=192 RepID=UPI0015558568|nr:hypothetical protein [Azospirillum brasilense]
MRAFREAARRGSFRLDGVEPTGLASPARAAADLRNDLTLVERHPGVAPAV